MADNVQTKLSQISLGQGGQATDKSEGDTDNISSGVPSGGDIVQGASPMQPLSTRQPRQLPSQYPADRMEIDNEPDADLDDGDAEDKGDTGNNNPMIELQMDLGKKQTGECIRAEQCFTVSCTLA
jgi:hypothetical protein